MELSCLFVSARSAVLKLFDRGLYETVRPYQIRLNGKRWCESKKVITSLYGLWPDTEYAVEVRVNGELVAQTAIHTKPESYTLNVRRFGAVGDGLHDDTAAIQAAIACCPEQGRVLIPAGSYLIKPLFLKSHITLEWETGAYWKLNTERSQFPVLPGMTLSTDETDDLNLGTWEGNPLDAFASMITGVQVEDVNLIGQGIIDGQAQLSDWWKNPKVRRGAWRPKLLFLNHCRNITVQGLRFQNSPSWNLHPYFSDDLSFLDISVTAPADSPNTDGFDPESCHRLLLAGAHFSLGDDCIALKSGKLYMGRRYKRACEDVNICHCLMENGHGGVTAGSEMSGGIRKVRVSHCLMRNTDRGLRVKTRRGRGKEGVIDDIVFDHVTMDHVSAPFVVNALYFCDPDGYSAWVQSRKKMPVTDDTPRVGSIAFRHVEAENCSACAGYFLGLPEKPIENVLLENCTFTYAEDAKSMQPAMADGVSECLCLGIVAKFVDKITLQNVHIQGQMGEKLDQEAVEQVEGRII